MTPDNPLPGGASEESELGWITITKTARNTSHSSKHLTPKSVVNLFQGLDSDVEGLKPPII